MLSFILGDGCTSTTVIGTSCQCTVARAGIAGLIAVVDGFALAAGDRSSLTKAPSCKTIKGTSVSLSYFYASTQGGRLSVNLRQASEP